VLVDMHFVHSDAPPPQSACVVGAVTSAHAAAAMVRTTSNVHLM